MLNPLTKNKAKILIVDDNSTNLTVLGQLLKGLSYKCEFALSGKEALKRLDNERFDLILLDVVMPDINGYEVCEKIKEQKQLQHIPIIFITIKQDLDSMVKGFNVGAVDYINKPFNSDELSARISTQIELKRSRDELRFYNGELEKKNKFIMDSIRYAQYIQDHIIPDVSIMNSFIKEQFLLFKPKDLLSGDIYWCKAVGEKIIFSVIDCTGHGVPAALLSIAAITALNQGVVENKLIAPSDILHYADEYFLKLFRNKEHSSFQDGMDLTICLLDTASDNLIISGARQKAYLFKNGDMQVVDGSIFSIGDRISLKSRYDDKVIPFSKGDTIYLQSDGVIDQFGGAKGTKFGSKRYIKLLQKIQHLSMNEQFNIIKSKSESWQGEHSQIDDITVWGIKY